MSMTLEERTQYEEQKKEVFMELLKKEEVTFVLRCLDEGTKGSESFQRMKLKNLLNLKQTKQGKKFTPWDYLKKTIGMKELKGLSPTETIKTLKVQKDEVPTFIRYLSFMSKEQELFDKNFEKIKGNIKNNRDILFGVCIEQTHEEAKAEIISSFNKGDEVIKHMASKLALNLVDYADEIVELTERLQNVPVENYIEVELDLLEEGYPFELVPFVYLVTGDHDEEMRRAWYYLATERMAHRLTLDRKIKNGLEEAKEKKNKEEAKAVKDKEESSLRKQFKKINQENKQLEEKLKEVSERYSIEKEAILKEIEVYQQQIKGLMIEIEEQKKELKSFEQKIGGYSLNLATDFSEIKLMVAHTSPVLYAPIIFPDVKFVSAQELISKVQKKTTEKVILQKGGLSYMEYRQIIQVLKDKGIACVEIDALEEREIIMKVSAFIENQLEK